MLTSINWRSEEGMTRERERKKMGKEEEEGIQCTNERKEGVERRDTYTWASRES